MTGPGMRVAIATLGCKVNRYDTAVIEQRLEADIAQALRARLMARQHIESLRALPHALVEGALRELAPHQAVGDSDRQRACVERNVLREDRANLLADTRR